MIFYIIGCTKFLHATFLAKSHATLLLEDFLIVFNHVFTEISQDRSVCSIFCISMLKDLWVNSRLVDFDHHNIIRYSVREAHLIFGVQEEGEMPLIITSTGCYQSIGSCTCTHRSADTSSPKLCIHTSFIRAWECRRYIRDDSYPDHSCHMTGWVKAPFK